MKKEAKQEVEKLAEEEILKTEFDTNIEVEEDRANLSWTSVAHFLIING